ncbi:hypothetical protein B2J86_08545 [Acidovorax sp. SRB_14]|uniref:hypothetical protein n=1 Tax=unclassified Acidovorax TaxID=2684926 RepID=UPI00145F8ECC|nr:MULTISPECIES: hypothetical protein [unclassified Acidovorax]NMM77493.1 hypothetical protein [Acidovorax sp. SRB_24]NMM80969.1 hypothetical protein [Acidovorax sp. SRB_14]NMM89009.1 hypothetical protein [Rhodococcus sp. SRB_17]
MKKTLTLTAAILWLGLAAPAAHAACYLVYGPGQQLVYRAPEPPVDLSRPLHETLPAVAPGGTLVFSLDSHGCEREIRQLPPRSGASAVPARPGRGAAPVRRNGA